MAEVLQVRAGDAYLERGALFYLFAAIQLRGGTLRIPAFALERMDPRVTIDFGTDPATGDHILTVLGD